MTGTVWEKENRPRGKKFNSCLRDVHVFLPFFFSRQLRGNLAQTGVVWEGAKGEFSRTARLSNATPGEENRKKGEPT